MEIGIGIVCLLIGAGIAVLVMRNAKTGSIREAEDKIQSAHAEAEQVMGDARRAADTLKKEALLEAKEEIIQNKQAAEAEEKLRKKELRVLENRVMQREESLDRRNEALDKREHQLSSQQGQIEKKSRELNELYEKQTDELERIAELTREDAHRELLDKVRGEVTHEAATIIRDSEQKVKAECHKTAQEIISLAIQRCAADHTAEVTVTSVHIPSDDLKGRIIGREGRNIRTFEQVSGVNLVIDDTPETVVLSSFDPVRRETARVALENLIADGRIHPARIEEMYQKAADLVQQRVREAGEQACFDTGIHDLHPEIVKTLGALRYRTSFGQNVLQHSIEVSELCAIMASELGVDVRVAKRAGLLHDLGKAIDHDVEGSPTPLSAPISLAATARSPLLSTRSRLITAMSTPTPFLPCLSRLQMQFPRRVPVLAASLPRTTSSGLRSLRRSPTPTTASRGHMPCRLVARSTSWCSLIRFPMLNRPFWLTTSLSRSRKRWNIPGQVRVVVIRESRAVDIAK